MSSGLPVFDGSNIDQWEESAKSVWNELLRQDLSRDTEGLTKCLLRLCFLLASREKQVERYREAKKLLMVGGTAGVPSPISQSGDESSGRSRVTLQTIETLLRKEGARVCLMATKRREKHSDELVFRYPGRAKPAKYYVSVCIEGAKSARVHATINGWTLEENFDALADTGFIVREPHNSIIHHTAIDMLQSLPDIVQLTHESPLLPSTVPRQWWPAHCETCRRVASLPTTLYKLPCCANRYCCSADCWRVHANETHSANIAKPDRVQSDNHKTEHENLNEQENHGSEHDEEDKDNAEDNEEHKEDNEDDDLDE